MAEEITIPQVQVTRNYQMFKKQKYNRFTTKGHTQELLTSFTEHPELRPTKPVVVNEKFEVIDGQHSLLAAEAGGLEVYYMTIPRTKIEHTRLVNRLQRSWGLADYIHSFKGDSPHYRRLVQLHETYPMAYSNLAALASGKVAGGSFVRRIKAGNFTIDDPLAGIQRLNKVLDFAEFAPTFWNADSFVLAISKLLSNPDYNHDVMMSKLKEPLVKRTAWRDYTRDLESIYNKGNAGQYVRFL